MKFVGWAVMATLLVMIVVECMVSRDAAKNAPGIEKADDAIAANRYDLSAASRPTTTTAPVDTAATD